LYEKSFEEHMITVSCPANLALLFAGPLTVPEVPGISAVYVAPTDEEFIKLLTPTILQQR
jgi:hypothetical protein